MPVISAIVGAIMTGVLYWFLYGTGTETLDRTLGDRRNAKLRARSVSVLKAAPLWTRPTPRAC